MRSIGVSLGFKAVASGLRIPKTRLISDFAQWGRTIDIVERERINVFLDVGANRGFYSKHLRSSGFKGHIFSFEPIPEDADRIKRLAAADDKWTVCDFALGDEAATKTFNIHRSGAETVLSSFFPMTGQTGSGETARVQIKRLDDILPELIFHIPEPRIFLKMDTQGYDLKVIDGATQHMHMIHGLQSEVSLIPLYQGMPHLTESLSRFEGLGFGIVDMFVVNRTTTGHVLEYDCLMSRLG